jgi:hypothetical protein
MPRTEARIFTSIWDDPDFLALTGGAQRLYMFLLSQRELSYCGVMPLRPARWARKAAGLTLADIERDLKELEGNAYPSDNPGGTGCARRPFVITDPDVGELLMRSLIRRDSAWKQPNLLKQAIESSVEIESSRIRMALLAEVRRLPVDDSPSAQVRTLVEEFAQYLSQGLRYPYDDPIGHLDPDPTGNSGQHPSGDPLGNSRPRTGSSKAPTSGLQPLLSAPPATDRKLGTRLPDDWLPSRELVDWARGECPNVDSKRETERFRDYWHAKPGKDGRKLDWVKTWKNWMRTAQDRQGPRDRGGVSKLARGRELVDTAARMDEEQAALVASMTERRQPA